MPRKPDQPAPPPAPSLAARCRFCQRVDVVPATADGLTDAALALAAKGWGHRDGYRACPDCLTAVAEG